ncbi:MAG: pro-sigmaK processing inhibitor BofA family protein [Ruminococcus sp.]|nr:pro-sigmaK processing inhibitor BofA family protein [Ruminococcus sp.]
MLIWYDRRRHRLRSFLAGAVSGLAALMLVNIFGGYIGTSLHLNLFNLCGSAVLGVPFVVCMTVLSCFL